MPASAKRTLCACQATEYPHPTRPSKILTPKPSFRCKLNRFLQQVLITCENAVGLVWALATLRQMLAHWYDSKICVAMVIDKPRLNHRGVRRPPLKFAEFSVHI